MIEIYKLANSSSYYNPIPIKVLISSFVRYINRIICETSCKQINLIVSLIGSVSGSAISFPVIYFTFYQNKTRTIRICNMIIGFKK